ncbi:MAG: hypothetical protein AB1705_26210 [Verrucomicrobiota bacterium]
MRDYILKSPPLSVPFEGELRKLCDPAARREARHEAITERAKLLAQRTPFFRKRKCQLTREQIEIRERAKADNARRARECKRLAAVELARGRCREASRFSPVELDAETRSRWRANIGHRCNEDDWLEGRAREQKLERMTHLIVERLKRAQEETRGYWGVDLRRPAVDGVLHAVDMWEEKSAELPSVKHQVFLPIVAHGERIALIREFTRWMQTHKHTRYYVVTTGGRCQIHEINARLAWAHEKLSEFRRLPEMQEGGEFYGINFVLRTDEFTIEREGDGLTFHPHINLAIHFPHFLPARRNRETGEMENGFLRFKRLIDEHFRTVVLDAGEIDNVHELIKYVCKYEKENEPTWTERTLAGGISGAVKSIGILDLSPCELYALYRVRAGMKPVQALGSFAQYRRRLRENRLKVISKFNGLEWKLAEAPMDPPIARVERDDDRRSEINLVVCVTEPQPRFSPVLRPCIIVKNFNGDYAGVRRKLRDLYKFVAEAELNQTLRLERARNPFFIGSTSFTETPEDDFCENEGDSPPNDAPVVRLAMNGEAGPR